MAKRESRKSQSEIINSDRYFVHYSKGVFTFYLILLFVVFAFTTVYFVSQGMSDPFFGTIFILCEWVFFGLFCLIGYLSGIYTREYFIRADENGLTINGRNPLFIPWEDIAGFESHSAFGRDYLGIRILDEEKYTGSKTSFGRLMLKQRKFFSDCLFEIDFNSASESLHEVLPELESRLGRYGRHVSAPRIQSNHNEGAGSEGNDKHESVAFAKRVVPKAKALVIGLIAVNILVFAANLFISNHCWTIVDFQTLVVLFKNGDLDTLWMPGGMLTLSELLWDGPMYDLGQIVFGLDTGSILEGHHLYGMFTYAFFHADIIHLLSNMIALYFFSSMVFASFGRKEFSIWYVAGIFGGALATLVRAAVTGKAICAVGASAAVFGLLGGSLAPIVYAIVLVKSKGGSFRAADRRTMFEYIAFVLIVLIPGFFEENVSWEGHLGGLLGGLIAGIVMLWIKYRGGEMPERKSTNRKQLNFGRKSEQQTQTYKMDNGTSYVIRERQEELDKDTLERRRKIGTIVLIAGMVCTVLVIISNVCVGFADYSKLGALKIPPDKAWHANLLWCVIGWIPNVVAHRFLRGSGKVYTILIVIAWILWLFVGPTGIFNPIPQSV